MATEAAETPCPGEGRHWQSGMGTPICPVCHRGPGAILGKPGRWSRAWGKRTLPPHALRSN